MMLRLRTGSSMRASYETQNRTDVRMLGYSYPQHTNRAEREIDALTLRNRWNRNDFVCDLS